MLPIFKIRKKRIYKRRKHSDAVKNEIIRLCSNGMRSKDIYKESKERFGYIIKQSSISNILHDAGLAEKIRENSFVDPGKGKKPGWKRMLREKPESSIRKAENEAYLQKMVEESGEDGNLDFENKINEYDDEETGEGFEPEFEEYEEDSENE